MLDVCFIFLLISDEAEDEDVNKEYTEETNRDHVMIAAAKLIAEDVVPKVNYLFLRSRDNCH